MEFVCATSAVVQKMRRDEHNMAALRRNYMEHWPMLKEPYDLVVVAIEEELGNEKRREIWCGFFEDAQWTRPDERGPIYRFLVDRFQLLGIHDYDCVSDAEFYGNGGRWRVACEGVQGDPRDGRDLAQEHRDTHAGRHDGAALGLGAEEPCQVPRPCGASLGKR